MAHRTENHAFNPNGVHWYRASTRLAFVTINKEGKDLLERRLTPEVIKAIEKSRYEVSSISDMGLREAIAHGFNHADHLVIVAAIGIVVRGIAPYLSHKYADPSVSVIDVAGRFAVALIAGHGGGGNAVCLKLEVLIGVRAVITTGTDALGMAAIEPLLNTLGIPLRFYRDPILAINKALLAGGGLGVSGSKASTFIACAKKHQVPLDPDSSLQVWFDTKPPTAIWEAQCRARGHIFYWIEVPTVVVGMGFRQGKTPEDLDKALLGALDQVGLRPTQIRAFATIERKATEEGFRTWQRHWKLPLAVVSLEAIKRVASDYKASPFVQETLGIPAVAEPCAEIAFKDLEPHGALKRYGNRIQVAGVTMAFAGPEVVKSE